ncbi:MAG: hypothetical protein QXW39_08190 [Candidatus Bathyarchaeia archaeon]
MSQENNWNLIQKIPDYLDDGDYLAILSMGRSKLSHRKIQKISYVLSNIANLEGNFVRTETGYFSETIMEKIMSPLNRNIYKVKDSTYSLTEYGVEIYDAIIEFLSSDTRQSLLDLLRILRKMNISELETWEMTPEKWKEFIAGLQRNEEAIE